MDSNVLPTASSVEFSTAPAGLLTNFKVAIRERCIYEAFEVFVIGVVTLAIMSMVAKGLWHLSVVVIANLLLVSDASQDQMAFQGIFGIIFTLLIAMEFKRSLLVGRRGLRDVVKVRPIILIAMLATVRRFIVSDLGHVDLNEAMVTSGGILSLGIVYWLVIRADNSDPEKETD